MIAVRITVTVPAGLAGLHDTGLYGDGLWPYIDRKVYGRNRIRLRWPSLCSIIVILPKYTYMMNCKSACCHILEFWLSPTPMSSWHLWSHLQSYIATSPYARKVFSFVTCSPIYILVYSFTLVQVPWTCHVDTLVQILNYFRLWPSSYSKNISDSTSKLHSQILEQEPERGAAYKLKPKFLLTSGVPGVTFKVFPTLNTSNRWLRLLWSWNHVVDRLQWVAWVPFWVMCHGPAKYGQPTFHISSISILGLWCTKIWHQVVPK